MGTTIMSIEAAALTRLMTWLSPAFPVGGFSYSHGIEYAVETGQVRNLASLAGWIDGILRFGSGRIDAALFLAAHRAVLAADRDGLAWATERAEALRGTGEMALESTAQGTAFLSAVRTVWPHPFLDDWSAAMAAERRSPSYAVAVAVCAALIAVAERPALAAYLTAFAGNLISAAVRLIPLGQTDGLRAVAALEPVVLDCVDSALPRPLSDLGGAAFLVDWCSAMHETQYTRLFRS